LLDLIETMADDEKAVIFSEWTSFLDIIADALEEEGHEYTRLDGTMSPDERQNSMDRFTRFSPRFILCSLRAAGVGITLTRANVVFLMHPWWNFAEEAQAMVRCLSWSRSWSR
jgi:DNA repair protein RAD5